MIARRMLLTGIAACALAGGLLLVGCGSDDSPVASVASTTVPEPLPIEGRVVEGNLGGVSTDKAPQVANTPEEFARLVDEENPAEEAASLRKAGFVTGAVTIYGTSAGEVFGISGAIQYGSPDQAVAELARLAKEFSSAPSEAATRGTLAGVPGSRTIEEIGRERGQAFAFGAALFTDGPFLYAQLAGGAPETVRPHAVLEAAGSLYERVKGPPGTDALMGVAWRKALPLRWALCLGALSGLVAAGVGSRVVMKIIALADPSTDGTLTDVEARVGEFTVAGTLGLLVLGTVAGVMGGLLYLGVRRWLPVPPAWKGVAFGVLTLATVGNVLIDDGNVDFQIFEPVLLVIALFSALFFVNGLLLAGLMAHFHPEPAYAYRPWAWRVAAGVIVAVCVVGAVGLVGGVLGMVEDQGTCLRAVGGGNGCAVLAVPDPPAGGRPAGSGGS